MENITTHADLKIAISVLESKQAEQELQLKEQFVFIYESLKPANLLQSTINEMRSSPYLINNVIDAAVGLAAGYLSRKAVIKKSDGIFRKLLGFVLQFGITNLIAQHPENIKSFGRLLYRQIFQNKETDSTHR